MSSKLLVVVLCNMRKMRPEQLYKKPYYRESDREFIDEEARKFLFSSNEDLKNVKRTLQGIKRTMVQVSFLKLDNI